MADAFYDPTKTFDQNFDDGPAEVAVKTLAPSPTTTQQFNVFGHQVASPFGIPAGPLPNSKYTRYAFEHGFDVVCYKTQRSVPFDCNQFPNVLYLDIDGDLTLEKAAQPQLGLTTTSKLPKDLSITNSFGNPSRGPEFWVDDLKRAISYQGKDQLLIMSVVGTVKEGFTEEDYWDDFAATAELAASTGVGAIEVNLSCPNVATEGVLCYNRDAVVEICKRTKAKIGDTPLIAKFGYFSTEQQPLLEKIITDAAPYLAGVSAINTIAAPIVDKNGQQALPGPNRLKSGVCGASIKWAGLDMVKRLAALRQARDLSFQIIGVGGVMTPDDFKQYRQAGADVVMSATGAMWNPNLAAEVKATL